MYSMHSSKTDLSDIGLCSFNAHESNFNLMLCYLQLKEWDKTLLKLNELIGHAPKKYSKQFHLLRGLIYETYGNQDKAEKDFAKF